MPASSVLGTDSNQNGLHPGKVLTSIRKRVDNAVYDSFTSAVNGSFAPGIQVLGLKEGGMDWVLDENNQGPDFTEDMKAAADAAVDAISERGDCGP
jgi:basic membrane protein A